MIVWLITTALAKPPLTEADNVDAQWRAMQVLRVRPESYRVIKEPITVREGPLTVTLDRGVMIPIFSGFHAHDKDGIRQARAEAFARDSKAPPPLDEGDVEFVGFVFTAAEGTFEVEWQERADNLIFANHQVTHLNQDKADWVDVAHGAPWTGVVNEGFILSTDPELARAFVGPDDPKGTPEDIVVYGKLDYAAARARARVLFHDRRQRMMDRDFHPGRGVAWDRVADKFGLETRGKHHVIDLHIDRNVGSPSFPPGRQPSDIDWISLLQDWTGVLDSRRHSLLIALDRTLDETLVDWVISGVPFPPSDPEDPTSPPLPPARLVTDEAFIVVQAIPVTAQLRAEVLARLKLTAVGGDFQVVQLNIPRHATQHDWKLLSVTDASGTPLVSRSPLIEHSHEGMGAWSAANEMRDQSGVDKTPFQFQEGTLRDQSSNLATGGLGEPLVDVNHSKPHSRVTLALPEPIRKGETLVVDVRWQDVWPYGDAAFVEQSGGRNDDDMPLPPGLSKGMAVLNQNAAASGPQPVLPLPAGSPPDAATKFQIQVVVPERTKLAAAASGELVKTWSQDGYAYSLSSQLEHSVPYPEVHVGAFVVHDEAAAAGMPTVRTRTFMKDVGQSLAAETRAQINFFQGFLPKYPWTEHEIALGPSGQNRLWWASGHGLTGAGITGVSGVFQGGKLSRQAGSHTTQRLMAHELAHQWFGQSLRPADQSDAWFCETFAEVFGVLYIQALYADVDKVYDIKRRKFETLLVLPATRIPLVSAHTSPYSQPILFDYGPYLFQEMLRPRLGDERYFGAIDLLARDFSDRAVTTEHIEGWFQQAADRDLGAFFDFWVYGGFIPKKVELEWDWADGQLSAVVTGDVPFGTFDVPVVVDGASHWVDVVDGSGELVLDAPTEPDSVELDPDHRILAVKRAIKRRSGLGADASSP